MYVLERNGQMDKNIAFVETLTYFYNSLTKPLHWVGLLGYSDILSDLKLMRMTLQDLLFKSIVLIKSYLANSRHVMING